MSNEAKRNGNRGLGFWVCGFGNQVVGRLVPSGITTIKIDAYGMGRTAGRMVMAALNGQADGERIVDCGFELVPRAST